MVLRNGKQCVAGVAWLDRELQLLAQRAEGYKQRYCDVVRKLQCAVSDEHRDVCRRPDNGGHCHCKVL